MLLSHIYAPMQIITSPFLILYDKGEGLVAQLDILLLAKDE